MLVSWLVGWLAGSWYFRGGDISFWTRDTFARIVNEHEKEMKAHRSNEKKQQKKWNVYEKKKASANTNNKFKEIVAARQASKQERKKNKRKKEREKVNETEKGVLCERVIGTALKRRKKNNSN